MSAQDAIDYGIIDKIIQKDSNAIDKVMNVEEWDSAAGLVRAN
jgi:ATP-dependent protease ClpP protease subunit